jgi:uncharacterized protein
MDPMTLTALAGALRASPVFRGKAHIRPVAEVLAERVGTGAIRNGDDTAAIPDGDGWLLFAAEGIVPALVRRDPYLAGRCAALANVNDVYAMGGRPMALVDVIGTTDDETARQLCRGLRDGAARYGVPIVGGHVLRTAADVSLSVAIIGRARALVTSFDAVPGDRLVLVTNSDGRWLADHGFWNATLTRNDAELPGHLELLPRAAEAGLVRAGKDVSMSGVSGTLVMLAESSRVGARLEIDRFAPPAGVPLLGWLLAFMSYGFLLAVAPARLAELAAPFRARGLEATDVGEIIEGSTVTLASGTAEARLWDWRAVPFTGVQG